MWKQNKQTSLECVSDPHEQINCVANDQWRDNQIWPVVCWVGYLWSYPSSYHHPPSCSPPLLLSPLSLFFWATLFGVLRYFVVLSSQHPLHVTLTCHLGCLDGSVCCLPLPSYLVSTIFIFPSSFLILSALHPLQETLTRHLGCCCGSACCFSSALMVHLTHVADFCGPASLCFWWQHSVCCSRWVSRLLFSWYGQCSHLLSTISVTLPLNVSLDLGLETVHDTWCSKGEYHCGHFTI